MPQIHGNCWISQLKPIGNLFPSLLKRRQHLKSLVSGFSWKLQIVSFLISLHEQAAVFLLIFGQFSACLDFTACVKQTSKIPEFFLEEQALQKTQGPFFSVFAMAPWGAVSNSDVTSHHCQALLRPVRHRARMPHVYQNAHLMGHMHISVAHTHTQYLPILICITYNMCTTYIQTHH